MTNKNLDELNHGKIIFFTWKNDSNWTVEHVSSSITSILGYLPQEFISGELKYLDIIHPDDIEHVEREVATAAKGSSHEFTHKPYRIRDKLGEYHYIYDHTVIIRDENKQITHYQGYIYDDTELILQKERLELVLEGTNLGLWDWNPKTNEVTFDERWAKMLGHELNEIEFNLNSWESRAHPDDIEQCYQDIQSHIDGDIEFYSNIHRMRHKDGTWRYILDRGKVVEKNADGEAVRFTGAHADVTDFKLLEQKLLKSNQELKLAQESAHQASKAKSVFLANMSHEIRTPIHVIMGQLQLLEFTQVDITQQRHIAQAQDASKILLELLNDLLDFTKIESGKFESEVLTFDLYKLVESVKISLLTLAKDKQLALISSYDKHLPHFYVGDIVHIKQVLINLITNAIKFTNEGHIKVTIDGKALSDNQYQLDFEVSDTGIGISSNQLKQIFESFTQIQSSLTREYQGNGLGLSISKSLVELMGGNLTVKSQENKGSQFRFSLTLPRASQEQVEQLNQMTSAVSLNIKQQSSLNGIHILVVEDNIVLQKTTAQLLQHEGAIVTIANNGQEAIDILNQQDIAIVLMDVQMPIMDGYSATEIIRKKYSLDELPIIAMTAHATKNDKKIVIQSGMNDYLAKPINFVTMIQTLLLNLNQIKPELRYNESTAGNNESLIKFNYPDSFDLESALARLNNMPSIYLVTANLFLSDTVAKIKNIHQSLREGEQEKTAKTFHSLKGGALQIGATDLANYCILSESKLLSRIDKTEYNEILNGLDACIKKTIHELKLIINEFNKMETQQS